VSKARLLLVEDDESLGFVLSDAFEREGYRLDWERDGRAGLAQALEGPFDLLVLDLMLPGLDGYEICRRVRAAGLDVPILMLTARAREEDRVQGLDLGADDYVVKPFSLRELMARVRARLRARKPIAPQIVELGDVRIDLVAMVVTSGESTTALTKLEAGVLTLLFANPGMVLSRGRFLDEVWGYHRHPTTRTVDMHVARVREKIGDAGPSPRYIRTVHGIGYRFDPT
jgi:DNA-binding response OmpR family regulator